MTVAYGASTVFIAFRFNSLGLSRCKTAQCHVTWCDSWLKSSPVCTWLLLHSLVWVSQLEEKRLDQVRIVHFMLLLYEWMESLSLSDDIYDILLYSLHVLNLPVGLMPTKLKSQQHSYMVWTMDRSSVLSHAYARRATRSRLHDGLQKFVWRRFAFRICRGLSQNGWGGRVSALFLIVWTAIHLLLFCHKW